MATKNVFQPAPVRNASVVGVQVYSHSGEFSTWGVDLALPGRGVSFQFTRTYRSALCQETGPLGRGWTFTYAKRIERVGDGILYHDGLGWMHRFTSLHGKSDYASPGGFYAVLTAEDGKIYLRQRYGNVFVFETPEDGGRLLVIRDRNGNALEFNHAQDALYVTDSLGHQVILRYAAGRIAQVSDHVGRVWQYKYSQDECLVEVIQPPTEDIPDGPRIRYGYDKDFRLISITNAKGQTFLQNTYDAHGRVQQQKHGNGNFEFHYDAIGQRKTEFPIYRTQVRLKNDARLVLTHDTGGHVVERTVFVEAESLSPEDRRQSRGNTVPLTTHSKFNRHGELIERVFPAGDSTQWVYDENNEDPRAQGNLLQAIRKPAPGIESDQPQLITHYTYEPHHQRPQSSTDSRGHISTFEYDARGNLTRKIYPRVTVQDIRLDGGAKPPTRTKQLIDQFEYNSAGQLIRAADPRGAVTEYHYYPASDPAGAKGRQGIHLDAEGAGGYLARIVRDPANKDRPLKGKPAHLVLEFGYDASGNVTTTWDGKGNPTRVKYDTQNLPISITSREPFKNQIALRYDANGNLVETTTAFERYQYDSTKRESVKSSQVELHLEYDVLNNLTCRTLLADGQRIEEKFIRDANENVIRAIQPEGNATEYRYDASNLLLERRSGVGTRDETRVRYTYTPNGRLRAMTDGRGNTIRHDYDGFQRYRGFTNAAGASKKQWLDEAGNVTRIELTGDLGLVRLDGKTQEAKSGTLLKSLFHYDELNRPFRVDRVWVDPVTGEPLGESRWDGEKGVVSSVIEYADNHKPAKVWYETGNVISLEYDGVNRVIAASDATGESVSIEFDENGNRVHMERLGPKVDQPEQRFQQITLQQFNALDRLSARSVNDELPDTFTYNALGMVASYRNRAGEVTHYLHDAFGRSVGQASPAVASPSPKEKPPRQLLVRRVELDRNSRVLARIDSAGQRIRYEYDALNRLTRMVYPDGTLKQFKWDGSGNLVRIVDQNGNVMANRFDALNRLVERRLKLKNGKNLTTGRFEYNGLNHLVFADTRGISILRRYDSLSRLLEETQAGRTVRYGYNSAGNRTRLIYPSGQQVRKEYDLLMRVSEVRDGDNNPIAQYAYRSSHQLKEIKLGKVLHATFAYKACQGCLGEIVYRSLKNGSIVEGTRYQYDLAGNRTEEVQLHRGESFGERYMYDSLNRLVGVQYGVQDLDKANSPFEKEVRYDLSPVGTWLHKTVRDAKGRILERWDGVTNKRHAYVSLGPRRFQYDKNGYRIREFRDDDKDCAEKRYAYDYAGRLAKVVCLDAYHKIIRTIEYTYDVFSRPLLRRVTDDKGKHETAQVWNGSQMVEEWENGRLARSYVFGARVNEPVQMTTYSPNPGEKQYYYTYNGRGDVTGLVDELGQSAERYGYDVFGQPSLTDAMGKHLEGILGGASPLRNPWYNCGVGWDPTVTPGLGIPTDTSTNTTLNPGETILGDALKGMDGGTTGCGNDNDYSPGGKPTGTSSRPPDISSSRTRPGGAGPQYHDEPSGETHFHSETERQIAAQQATHDASGRNWTAIVFAGAAAATFWAPPIAALFGLASALSWGSGQHAGDRADRAAHTPVTPDPTEPEGPPPPGMTANRDEALRRSLQPQNPPPQNSPAGNPPPQYPPQDSSPTIRPGGMPCDICDTPSTSAVSGECGGPAPYGVDNFGIGTGSGLGTGQDGGSSCGSGCGPNGSQSPGPGTGTRAGQRNPPAYRNDQCLGGGDFNCMTRRRGWAMDSWLPSDNAPPQGCDSGAGVGVWTNPAGPRPHTCNDLGAAAAPPSDVGGPLRCLPHVAGYGLNENMRLIHTMPDPIPFEDFGTMTPMSGTMPAGWSSGPSDGFDATGEPDAERVRERPTLRNLAVAGIALLLLLLCTFFATRFDFGSLGSKVAVVVPPITTPTHTPTNTMTNTPTNTPTGTPTNTPTSTPTNTPTKPAAPALPPFVCIPSPVAFDPPDGKNVAQRATQFQWRFDGVLPPGAAFALLVSDNANALEIAPNTSVPTNIIITRTTDKKASVDFGGWPFTRFYWTVVIVDQNGVRLDCGGKPNAFVLQEPPGPPPPACIPDIPKKIFCP